jgi:hypothetical protein
MYGAETCRCGINIRIRILLVLTHFNFKKCMVQATKKKVGITRIFYLTDMHTYGTLFSSWCKHKH